MWPSVPASSISTDRGTQIRAAGLAAAASFRARALEFYISRGALGYAISWILIPVFQLAVTGLVYHGHRPELLAYSVIGIAASAFIFNMCYFLGQLLDEERMGGTLVGLFLAPCPRMSWLAGFTLAGLVETVMAATAAIVFGAVAYGVRFDPDYPALVLSFLFFVASLWGLGLIFSAVGLAIKRSNDLANLISSLVFLLGGIYYPIALLPAWLGIPAHALPIGYGVQAMSDAALHHTGIAGLAPQLLPLAGFAITLPILGSRAFSWVERAVRERGELDLY